MDIYFLIKDQVGPVELNGGGKPIYDEGKVRPFLQSKLDRAKRFIEDLTGFEKDSRGFYRGLDDQIIMFSPEGVEVQLQNVHEGIVEELVKILEPKYFINDAEYDKRTAHLDPIEELVGEPVRVR